MTKPDNFLIGIDDLVRDCLEHIEKLRWLRQEFARELERADRAPSRAQQAWIRRAGRERATHRARRQSKYRRS